MKANALSNRIENRRLPIGDGPDSANFITVGHTISENLQDCSCTLEKLARAFGATGNVLIADQLWTVASCLNGEADAVRKLIGERISADVRHSSEATGNMLRACLAGALIGAKGQP